MGKEHKRKGNGYSSGEDGAVGDQFKRRDPRQHDIALVTRHLGSGTLGNVRTFEGVLNPAFKPAIAVENVV